MTVRIIDIESCSLEPTDGVVEIASVDLTREFTLDNLQETLVNPGRPIPALASAVHHLLDEDVKDAPCLADAIAKFRGADVYVAHNAGFEQSFLHELLGKPKWVCTYKAALRVWPELPSHANQFLRYHLGLSRPFDAERASIAAHRARGDVIVTAAILLEIMKEASWGNLITWSREPALYTVFNFGKHKGQRYDAVPVDYLNWIVSGSEMSEDVKFSANYWLGKRRVAA